MMKPPKGIKIKDIVIGNGPIAIQGKSATFRYKCFLPRGELLKSAQVEGFSVGKRGEHTFFAFTYGLLGMAEGGLRKVIVSPNLTYFEKKRFTNLPVNATLCYEIELIKISQRCLSVTHIFKEYSVGQLLIAIKQPPGGFPWAHLQELARRKGKEVEQEILKLLNSSDPLIRSYLIAMLSFENNLSPYISKIEACLLDSNLDVVIEACEALSKINYTEKNLCKAILMGVSQDNWLEVFALFLNLGSIFRIEACNIFVQYGSNLELDLLNTLQGDIHPDVRLAASQAILFFKKRQD